MVIFYEFGGPILNQPKEKPLQVNLFPESSSEPSPQSNEGQFFEILIDDQLSDIWADWFEGMTIHDLDNGEMLLSGYVIDQSALMGILNKLIRLNLTLLSVNEIKNKEKK
jgi:hypothetical protein